MDQQLSTLARADAARLKTFADSVLDSLGDIHVVHSRTGLVMLPMRDTAEGIAFHLGEVLVSEAHIEAQGKTGYGMRSGHDLEAAMAMAVVDLALTLGIQGEACAAFCQSEADALAAADRAHLCKVEATRVDMETF